MLSHYLKLTWKVLNRRRFFTFVSLFGICFTLVILTIITALMDREYGPHYPEVHADRILGVFEIYWQTPGGWGDAPPGYTYLSKYVSDLPHTEAISFTSRGRYDDYVKVADIRADLKRVDSAFWHVMQFEFLEGKPYTKPLVDDSPYVAVISQRLRQKIFGSTAAVGEMVAINRDSFRVVGVVKDVPHVREMSFADVWVPVRTLDQKYLKGNLGRFQALILANSRADFPAIRRALAQRQREEPTKRVISGTSFNYVIVADTYFEYTSRKYYEHRDKWFFDGENIYQDYSWIYLARWAGIMLVIMVLPAVNLINLNVSRLMERASEIGVRKAYGASSRKLVGQFVFENVMLTLVGGVISFVLAYGLLAGYVEIMGSDAYGDILPNMRVFGYGVLITLVFGVLSSAYPAWRMSRLHPAEILGRRTL